MPRNMHELLASAPNDSLKASLLELLRTQAVSYTQGDSSSLPAETMLELLASLLYTLHIDPADPCTEADGSDLSNAYQVGYRSLLCKTETAQKCISILLTEAPPLGCIALNDTVRSIHTALANYDARYFAHRIPGSIDYQLSVPVPDSVQGIDYILCYLANLRTEMRFIARFPLHRVLALLDGANPDWRETITSLCPVIAANALGLALLGKEPTRLHIKISERDALLQIFRPLHALTIENRLFRAGTDMLAQLDLRKPQDLCLLRTLCQDLAPRIKTAAAFGDLSRVFASFGPPKPAHSMLDGLT